MSLEVVPLSARSFAEWRALADDPACAADRHVLAADGFLADPPDGPHIDADGRWIALLDGRPAGLCGVLRLPSRAGDWAMLRLGVLPAARRREVGSALLATALDHLTAPGRPPVTEVCVSAWAPCPALAGLVSRRGFTRWGAYYFMERPAAGVPPPAWPDGIRIRAFAGRDADFADWTRAYNLAFALQPHSVEWTDAAGRALAGRPSFAPDGLWLAERDGECVGFCLAAPGPGPPEIDVLGVVPAARARGLGRALLRHGCRWLAARGASRVSLIVDAQNDRALRLYRDEGFATAREREVWSRSPAAGPPRAGV